MKSGNDYKQTFVKLLVLNSNSRIDTCLFWTSFQLLKTDWDNKKLRYHSGYQYSDPERVPFWRWYFHSANTWSHLIRNLGKPSQQKSYLSLDELPPDHWNYYCSQHRYNLLENYLFVWFHLLQFLKCWWSDRLQWLRWEITQKSIQSSDYTSFSLSSGFVTSSSVKLACLCLWRESMMLFNKTFNNSWASWCIDPINISKINQKSHLDGVIAYHWQSTVFS